MKSGSLAVAPPATAAKIGKLHCRNYRLQELVATALRNIGYKPGGTACVKKSLAKSKCRKPSGDLPQRPRPLRHAIVGSWPYSQAYPTIFQHELRDHQALELLFVWIRNLHDW